MYNEPIELVTEDVITYDGEKPEQLKPEEYFPEDIEMLKARMKREAKRFSHNELARQYVDLYTTLIVLNKDYMALQKILKDEQQLNSLLEEAKKRKEAKSE